ncbi:MAG: hypothetical protein MUO23_01400 [Anaerolineales bacterium]|nr:hypothetical protein [Anaerolineales bacterium]
MSPPWPPRPATHIAIVGPCASGKSTLVEGLRGHGLQARQIAQEHSYVPAMWQILARPQLLVYLHASYAACTARKQLNWSEGEYQVQLARLSHARAHCDVLVNTDGLSPEQVLQAVLAGFGHGHGPQGTV